MSKLIDEAFGEVGWVANKFFSGTVAIAASVVAAPVKAIECARDNKNFIDAMADFHVSVDEGVQKTAGRVVGEVATEVAKHLTFSKISESIGGGDKDK